MDLGWMAWPTLNYWMVTMSDDVTFKDILIWIGLTLLLALITISLVGGAHHFFMRIGIVK